VLLVAVTALAVWWGLLLGSSVSDALRGERAAKRAAKVVDW